MNVFLNISRKGYLLLLLVPLFGWSQRPLAFPLRFEKGIGPFEGGVYPLVWSTDKHPYNKCFRNTYPVLRGLPASYKLIRQAMIILEYRQFIYQNMRAGKITRAQLVAFDAEKTLKFDSSRLVKRDLACFVNLAEVINEKKQHLFLLDANNNGNFSDDPDFNPPHEVQWNDSIKRHLVSVQYERKFLDKVIRDTTAILMTRTNGSLGFTLADFAVADINVEGRSYQLAISSNGFLTRAFGKSELKFSQGTDIKGISDESPTYSDSEYVNIGSAVWRYLGVDVQRNQVLFEEVANKDFYSPTKGFKAPLFSEADLNSGKKISLAGLKGKYVFVDFWGTWCAPCRAEIPHLKGAYTKIDRKKVQMVSIASGDELSHLKKFIRKEKLEWPQLLSGAITSRYRITAFPTNFIIDPAGRIINKDIKTKDLHILLNQLASGAETLFPTK